MTSGLGVGGVVSGGLVVADSVLDQPVSLWLAELSRAFTLNEYEVLALRPEATYVVLDCHVLLKCYRQLCIQNSIERASRCR